MCAAKRIGMDSPAWPCRILLKGSGQDGLRPAEKAAEKAILLKPLAAKPMRANIRRANIKRASKALARAGLTAINRNKLSGYKL